jgi:DNA-directed RNA polymerase specialized sigma24 family protein
MWPPGPMAMPSGATDTPIPHAGQFATTHWSVVLSAGRGEDTRSQEALTKLCRTYWYPLYAFIRRHGFGPEDAQDLTQAFFARLLEHHALATVDRAKGKFRSFLLASLRNFLSNDRQHAQAQKRGGKQRQIPVEITSAETRYGLEAADMASPDKLFERNWALSLLEHVLEKLRTEQVAAGKGAQFDQLRDWLMGDPDAPRYADLACQLRASEESLRMAVSRMRRRFARLLREEIAQTVSSPVEIEEEIDHLFAALSG